MEQQVLLRNSTFIFLIAWMMVACSPDRSPAKFLQQDSVSSYSRGGFFYVNDSLYSGKLFSFYPDTKDTLSIFEFFNGKENGNWRQFYPNGKRKEIREFKDGKKQGEYVGWWENGIVKFEFHFKEGEYEGTCRTWNSEGVPIQESNYVTGHEEGAQKAWYDNGKVRSNYVISKGRRYGLLGTKNCKNVSDSIFRAN